MSDAVHTKDPTAAARARRYRARKRKAQRARALALRKREGRSVTMLPLPLVADHDAGVTVLEAPTVTESVMPPVTHAVTVAQPKVSSVQPFTKSAMLPIVTPELSRRDAEPEPVR